MKIPTQYYTDDAKRGIMAMHVVMHVAPPCGKICDNYACGATQWTHLHTNFGINKILKLQTQFLGLFFLWYCFPKGNGKKKCCVAMPDVEGPLLTCANPEGSLCFVCFNIYATSGQLNIAEHTAFDMFAFVLETLPPPKSTKMKHSVV